MGQIFSSLASAWWWLFIRALLFLSAWVVLGFLIWFVLAPSRPLMRAFRRINELFWMFFASAADAMSEGGRRLPSSELLPPNLSGGTPINDDGPIAPSDRFCGYASRLQLMRGGRRGG